MLKLLDDTPLTFGKHKGEIPNEIAGYDAAYIVWLFDNLDTKYCTRKLRDICEEEVDEIDWNDEKDKDNFYGFDGW